MSIEETEALLYMLVMMGLFTFLCLVPIAVSDYRRMRRSRRNRNVNVATGTTGVTLNRVDGRHYYYYSNPMVLSGIDYGIEQPQPKPNRELIKKQHKLYESN